MEKHNLYFRVLESFDSKNCPFCYFVESAIEKYFNDILYEGVNDFGFIKKFRETRGFCNFHSYKLLSYKNAISIASLYIYLFKDILSDFENLNKRKNNFKKNNCQACNFIDYTEKMYISTFVNFINEKEVEEKFLKSNGFCVPHFINILESLGKKVPEWFIDFQYKKFENIFFDLKRYLDSKNVSLKEKVPKLTYEEELIYQKALKILSGYQGKK
ncbi:MAG: DUF6062 family protein [Brevinematales bacterium]|nr:DUF6062 family protein [Brevinematales bacterium]